MRTNIVKVTLGRLTTVSKKQLWKEDYGQKIQFIGVDLPYRYEVDFADSPTGQAITMIGDETGVLVPDELLQNEGNIYAYLYLHTGSDDGETQYTVILPVEQRAERTDIEPTPVQQNIIEQAIVALNDAVEQTAADVIAADASAQAAAGSATEASGYANEAKGYAERAESAESEAEEYATRAETAESHAQGYAQTASDKASEASGYASDAHGYADSASSSASDAQGYANDANGYSESASASASDASGYASSAYESAQNASGSASDASSAKDLAVQAKNDAVSAKESAEGFASDASDSANEAKGYAEDAEESAQSVLGLTADATVDSNVGTPSVEVEVTTESDHKNMSFAFHNLRGVQGEPGQSGLITDYIAEEKTPYLFRPSANGLANVISEKDTLIGGTVAWNQLFPYKTKTFSGIGWNLKWNGDGTITITVTDETASSSTNTNPMELSDGVMTLNHKYVWVSGNSLIRADMKSMAIYTDTIFNCTNAGYSNIAIIFTDLPQGTYTIKPMLIDLTQMFGSTIADYIYSLERANTGDGVAWFKRLFPKDYYPYNSGDLLSVQTSEHRMVGKNQFDGIYAKNGITGTGGSYFISSSAGRTAIIPCLPNTTYTIKRTELSNRFMIATASTESAPVVNDPVEVLNDANPSSLSAVTVTTGASAKYLCVYVSTSSEPKEPPMQVEIGSTATNYEEYWKHTYPLDSSLVLMGVLKLDASNNLYYHGDTYESDGTVTRKYGIVDLGSLTWTKRRDGTFASSGIVGYVKEPTSYNEAATVICSKYLSASYYKLWIDNEDKTFTIIFSTSAQHGEIWINDFAYTDVTAFKSSLSGTYLVYELTDSAVTTETADPYSEYQIVDADGTEEYVDERTVPIPVGHDTYYQQSVDVPQLPTADGAYRLALSKTGNTATASWEYVAQAEMKAQTNIPSGKYFSVGERLFVSTQAIAQGENIVVGTNCTETTLADALNTINS